MASDPDDVMADARAALDRARGGGDIGFESRLRAARSAEIGRKLTRIVLTDGAIILAAIAIGFFWPIGMFGALAVMALLIVATVFIAFQGDEEAAPPPEKLRQAPVRILPQQTRRWLDAQRGAVPRQARDLFDRIAARLDALGPQLAGLDDDAPAAGEVRKLVGEQLPDFIKDYEKVPPTLRATPRNGKSPDTQLTDGLALIEQEIAEMTARLAEGDLDNLATRGRYLEIKYRGDEGTGDAG